ncbi:SDR family oxidoreductase [Nonomuraea soli]|uniref:Uncharacterized protein YbjT (DUF2867 family) n=1 Tax=Nonomuraea soli TaxID=1032476 RepID=A0A7W0HSN9_9ACTN|nr:NmrA family NAD(P)-binding protein [Nonomuraea soli]MBA2894219.1 uncharacterized protein YbjT (DUF2867 family) [Nonomuraea soli]
MTTYLVLGARGSQGGAVARRLAGTGHEVRGLVRDPGGLPGGVNAAIADLADPAQVKAAFDGVTHASVTLPMVFDADATTRYVDNIARAAQAAGVRRLVLNTSNRQPDRPTGVLMFETRRAASETLLASGVPTVVLRPPVYLDNLRAPWVAGPLEQEGVLRYPLPAGLPVAWLSHDDLAALTEAALHRPGIDGEALDIGGPRTVTGPELAAAFSAARGREITYQALAPADFEAGLSSTFGPRVAAGIAATYHWLAEHGDDKIFAGTAADRLGVSLTPLEEALR